MAANLADVMLRNHVIVQRLSAEEVTRVNAFLEQIATELKRRLSGQDLTELAQSRLERMLERFNDYLAQSLGAYQKVLMSDLVDIAQAQADTTSSVMSTYVGSDFVTPAPAVVRAAALSTPLSVTGADGGKLLKDFVTDWTTVERKRVNNAIRLGVAQGKTNAQISQAIRGTAAAKYNDGILALTKRNADSIVHTSVQFVARTAREAVFDANDDIVEGVTWVATLDNHTCPRCGALDGVTFDLKSGPRPPLHIRCRCAVKAKFKTKSEFASLQKGGKRPAVGADGVEHLPAGTTYFQWIKTQPKSFQDFALGTSRAKLLRDGGLTATRFAQLQLDKNFQPMTLAEARAVDPLAFDKAGVDA